MPGLQEDAWVTTKDRAQCWNLLSLLDDCPCYFNFKSSLFSEHMNRLTSVLKPMLSFLKDLTECLILWFCAVVRGHCQIPLGHPSTRCLRRCLWQSAPPPSEVPNAALMTTWISEESFFCYGHQASSTNENTSKKPVVVFFFISGFVLTAYKEQPQFDKELKEHLSHLFFQRGPKCQGIKSFTCSKEM